MPKVGLGDIGREEAVGGADGDQAGEGAVARGDGDDGLAIHG